MQFTVPPLYNCSQLSRQAFVNQIAILYLPNCACFAHEIPVQMVHTKRVIDWNAHVKLIYSDACLLAASQADKERSAHARSFEKFRVPVAFELIFSLRT